MPDFHGQREHQYDHPGDNSCRHSNVAVSQGHFGRGTPTYSTHQDDPYNPEQQAYRERKNSDKKGDHRDPQRNPIPARLMELTFGWHPFLGYTFFAIAGVVAGEVR